jgi:hypothetical protein
VVEAKLASGTLFLRVLDAARAGDGSPHELPPSVKREGGRGLAMVGRLARWSESLVNGRREIRAEVGL